MVSLRCAGGCSCSDVRAIEFFSGLGGWRWALGARGRVVAAYDIDREANRTYRLNHGALPRTREIAALQAEELRALGADTWLLSPPCQPFSRLGRRKGLADPRSQGLRRLLQLFPRLLPERLVLENVVGFEDSDARQELVGLLRAAGRRFVERIVCPSELGIPNRRPRYYLVAAGEPLNHPPPPRREPEPLAAYLDPEDHPELYLDAATLARHGPGMDVVRPEDRRSACFTGAYGRLFVRCGSFLRTPRGVRRLAPTEIARLHGLPPEFRFPEELPLRRRYRLLGNGLNVTVARWILDHLP